MLAIQSRSTLYAKLALTLVGGVFALAELFAASGFAPLATVSFEYSPRGHVMVPVAINGENGLQFALDTGAGGHVVKPATAESLDLETRSPPSHTKVQGAHGEYEARFAEIDSLSVGGLVSTQQSSMVIDLSHVERGLFEMDGVLGVPFIGDYRVAIDFRDQKVDFFNQGGDDKDWLNQYGDMHAVKYTPGFGGLIFFDTIINGVKVSAVLDTGSGRTAVNNKAASALGLADDREELDLVSNRVKLNLDGAILTSDIDVEISDVPVFKAFRMDDEPAILIGTDYFKNRVLAIAYDTDTLYVSR